MGNEYEGKYELNNKSAQAYILSALRGEYTNKDTGEIIRISRKGAEKVTRHDAENEIHLHSIASIPQMIEAIERLLRRSRMTRTRIGLQPIATMR